MFRAKQLFILHLLFSTIVSPILLSAGTNYRKQEAWYHSATLAFVADITLNNNTYHNTVSIGGDFLRFYFRGNNHLLIGPGITYTTVYDDSETNLEIYFPSISFQYHFSFIGNGFFLRGDLGFGKIIVHNDYDSFYPKGGRGPGFQIGAGYAFPLSSETSLLVFAMRRYFKSDDIPYSDLILHVGWLW